MVNKNLNKNIMKNLASILLLFVLITTTACQFLGSNGSKTKSNGVQNSDGTIIKKKHFNNDPYGPVEWKVSVKAEEDGSTIRHGLSTRYSKNGKVYEKINYADNKKHGKRLTYHSTGKVWKEQSYVEGKLDGLCKRYDRNGKLSAEYTYKAGLPAVGLKEFTNLGKERIQPTIKIEKLDQIASANKYKLKLSLTGENLKRIKSVDFYMGDLIEGKYFHNNLNPAKPNSSKTSEFSFEVPKGQVINKTYNFVAVAKIQDGLKLILQKKVKVSVRGI